MQQYIQYCTCTATVPLILKPAGCPSRWVAGHRPGPSGKFDVANASVLGSVEIDHGQRLHRMNEYKKIFVNINKNQKP